MMKLILKESQVKNLLKSMGINLTDKITLIQTHHDLPKGFGWFHKEALNLYLNQFGPMYKIEGKNTVLIAQNQGNSFEDKWVIADENEMDYSEFGALKELGVEKLGLSLSYIIDNFFVEEPLNEQTIEGQEDKMQTIIQSYLDRSLSDYYGIKRFLVDYDEQFNSYNINIFFDRQIAIDMGGGINMLIKRAVNSVGRELTSIFTDLTFRFYEHFEN